MSNRVKAATDGEVVDLFGFIVQEVQQELKIALGAICGSIAITMGLKGEKTLALWISTSAENSINPRHTSICIISNIPLDRKHTDTFIWLRHK